MLKVYPLKREEVHEAIENSNGNKVVVRLGKKELGYIAFKEVNKEEIFIDFIIAKQPGRGHGEHMLHALFELGYEKISGDAIYGPHLFWERAGAIFVEEVDVDDYEGVWFDLTADQFYQEQVERSLCS